MELLDVEDGCPPLCKVMDCPTSRVSLMMNYTTR